ncbi:MAG: hypothetical protein GX066_00255 [Clostridiaceae bacterium]|nr:hypothetical protein [Clostridiaceae bacterium]
MSKISLNLNVWAIATDPIYIGTGGYSIGRVDNTIVRDPITKIPKIPGTSFAGTWRYYIALYLQSLFKDQYRIKRSERIDVDKISDLFIDDINNRNEQGFSEIKEWVYYEGNRYAAIKCAGQDESPQDEYSEACTKDTGHCGNCIVCKGFGFSKKDHSWQGMLSFSDLNIALFPIYTRWGTKWISSGRILNEAGLLQEGDGFDEDNMIILNEGAYGPKEGWLNLGWLNLPYKTAKMNIDFNQINSLFNIKEKDICIVPDKLISQIINSSLEVRTSVSIDPITGAAKDGALFTSEAIPRATVFYGTVRIYDKSMFKGIEIKINDSYAKINDLPTVKQLTLALKSTAGFYETLGIGGMTTRGFGRLKVLLNN